MVAFNLDTENENLAKACKKYYYNASDILPREMDLIEVKEYNSSNYQFV